MTTTSLRRSCSWSLLSFVCCACGSPASEAEHPVPLPTAPEAAASGSASAQTKLPRLYSKPTALVPRAVTSFGAAATRTHLYTIGGYFGIPHQYSREGQSADFARMQLDTGAWESLPNVAPVQSATLMEFGGKLFRVGGLEIRNTASEPEHLESLASVQRFDPALGQWQELTPLPSPRSSHEVALLGSELYVVGGWKLSGGSDSAKWEDVMYVADLSREPLVWRSVPVPFHARAFGVVAIDGKLVTVGGIGERGSISEVHIYDAASGSWSLGPAYPERGFGARAIRLGDAVVASAGSGEIHALRVGTNAWERIGRLAFPRAFHQLVALDEQSALAIGGIPGVHGNDRIRHVERLDLGRAPDPVARFELEAPGRAKNRQGIFLRDGQLYVFGGNDSLGQHDFAPENFVAEGHRLDLGSLEWKPLLAFPAARQSMQTIESKDGVGYAVGGFGVDGTRQTTQADVFRFDFRKETWTKSTHGLPKSRTQFGLVEHGGRLWAFGGLDFDGARSGNARFEHLVSVLTLDTQRPDEGFAEAGFSIPRPRRAFSAALLGDRYYLVGGMADGFEPVSDCDVYDFTTRSWSTLPGPNRLRIGAEMVALGGKLYLAAGRSKGADGKLGPDSSVEVFDPATGRWTMWIESLPMTDSHQMRMLPFGERLLVYSAQRSDAKVELLIVDPGTRQE